MVLYYKTVDGSSGEIDAAEVTGIYTAGDSLTISYRKYGYDEYDYGDYSICDVISIEVQ